MYIFHLPENIFYILLDRKELRHILKNFIRAMTKKQLTNVYSRR